MVTDTKKTTSQSELEANANVTGAKLWKTRARKSRLGFVFNWLRTCRKFCQPTQNDLDSQL